MPLLLVQGFLNTIEVADQTDHLADGEVAAAWLRAAGLIGTGSRLSVRELQLARDVRAGMRGLLEPGGGEVRPDAGTAALRSLAGDHRARLRVSDAGAVGIENARSEDLGDAFFEHLLIIHGAQEDGSWSRLRVCANPDCRWVFYDRSRNRQGHWCDMAVCGNRIKNRKLRARRR
ncbi:MAG: CGNR zinc finger domain-containing protein [Solirubrobacterales bacterium]|nr:CGNR zinc finger domain-containing protein [Solirubrobacterales bacterium]